MTVALVTGAAGQDGSYLVERLLADGAEVHGLVRPGDDGGTPLPPGVHRHAVDLADRAGLRGLVDRVRPDELFHLAGVSSVAQSWQQPELTAELSGLAVVTLLDAALQVQDDAGRQVRFVQASSAEIFGEPDRVPQDESTAVRPLNPYGATKAFAHQMVAVYRARGLHAASCVLFNHESPRRPPSFVTRKITMAAARIARTGQGVVTLGNLDARRDWGWAPDYVDAMVRAARHDEPLDVVVATGETHAVRDFALAALRHAGVADAEDRIVSDPAFFRPADAAQLVGDATRARDVLGWRPTRGFVDVVGAMVDHDLEVLA
jgi:GDPmannose 4,6-dehydratase